MVSFSFLDAWNASAWGWISLGLLLCGAETFISGIFLLWVGLAAVTVGILNLFLPFDLALNLILFACLAPIFCLSARHFLPRRDVQGTDPHLNQPLRSLLNQEFLLEAPIDNNISHLRIADTLWRIKGPNVPAGTRIRVIALEAGNILRVLPLASVAPSEIPSSASPKDYEEE